MKNNLEGLFAFQSDLLHTEPEQSKQSVYMSCLNSTAVQMSYITARVEKQEELLIISYDSVGMRLRDQPNCSASLPAALLLLLLRGWVGLVLVYEYLYLYSSSYYI